MDKKLFGTRINKARKDRGLTAEKLAEACNINSTYLRQIEGGKEAAEPAGIRHFMPRITSFTELYPAGPRGRHGGRKNSKNFF